MLNASMLWKAQDKKIVQIEYINLRDFGLGTRKTVDDTVYGGGDGMLLRIEPLLAALEAAKLKATHSTSSVQASKKQKVVLMTPRGETLKQKTLTKIAEEVEDLIIICGRYEGYDERITKFVDLQISVGDYVLTGGEIPAMILVDGVVRLIPGVLGGEKSAEIESFTDENSVEFPQYTRPEEFHGMSVPRVLLSGNHAEIAKWRQENRKVD